MAARPPQQPRRRPSESSKTCSWCCAHATGRRRRSTSLSAATRLRPLKASSYFLAGGDSEDLVQEGLIGLYKAVRDFRADKETSFRSFAELCVTRQIITAIKTATRFKHAPLNTYVSFSHTPAGQESDSECTLGDALPGPASTIPPFVSSPRRSSRA
jgi:RNA polymerase sigma-H factor